MSTTRDVLIEARRLLSEPGAWIQGEYAQDQSGLSCDVLETSAPACKFCLMGAVIRAASRLQVLGLVSEALDEVCQAIYPNNVDYWNDSPHRTQGEVLAVLDRVIG